MNFLKGKKTFLIIGIFAILAVLSLIANLVVPDWAWALLAASGLASIRDSIKHLSGNKGWKTYAAVIATVGMSVFQAITKVEIPPEVLTTIYTILGTFGIVGVRAALKGISEY